MDHLLGKHVVAAVEDQLDAEIDRLENLNIDDINAIREKRLKQLSEDAKNKRTWLTNGHGVYTELAEEKEFFDVSKKSTKIICHFYRCGSERCEIVNKHLKELTPKHLEAKFCKINAEKCPFLAKRLRIKVLPTIALIVDGHTKDFIVGFTDLGNRDDFSVDVLEWRIAQSGAINLNEDRLVAQNVKAGGKLNKTKKKTIRSSAKYSDDSDSDF